LKRFLIFALLGPPLGMLTAMWVLLPVLNWSQGGAAVFDYHEFDLMPLAYVVGLLPALLAAAFDGVLAKRKVRFRPIWCALFGFAVGFLPLVGARWVGFLHGSLDASLGLVGAAPAVICSWLSGKKTRQIRRQEAPS
jgi:hypothetical protein